MCPSFLIELVKKDDVMSIVDSLSVFCSLRIFMLAMKSYHYACLLFCILFIYGLPFFNIMVYNMFTLLLIFIIRFHWMLFQNNTLSGDEE